jgi:hypothetical protein
VAEGNHTVAAKGRVDVDGAEQGDGTFLGDQDEGVYRLQGEAEHERENTDQASHLVGKKVM